MTRIPDVIYERLGARVRLINQPEMSFSTRVVVTYDNWKGEMWQAQTFLDEATCDLRPTAGGSP